MLITECKYRSIGYDKLIRKSHYHNNTVEIVHLVSGNGNYIIHNNLYAMQEGAIYFIDGDKFHSSNPMTDNGYCRSMVSVDKARLYDLCKSIGADGVISELSRKVVINAPGADTDSIFMRMSKEYSGGNIPGAAACVMELINIMHKAGSSTATPPQKGIVASVLEYISNNLDKQFAEADICLALHISQSTLCHRFKREIQLSIMEYVRIQRYLRARDLLRSTDAAIADVAYRCGFGSAAHFCAFFKKMSGTTPGEYRKNK